MRRLRNIAYAWLPRKCDYLTDTDGRTDRRQTKWSLCAAMLRRRQNYHSWYHWKGLVIRILYAKYNEVFSYKNKYLRSYYQIEKLKFLNKQTDRRQVNEFWCPSTIPAFGKVWRTNHIPDNLWSQDSLVFGSGQWKTLMQCNSLVAMPRLMYIYLI